MVCATIVAFATARISQAPSLPWDRIRTDPGWKRAWAAEQKADEMQSYW